MKGLLRSEELAQFLLVILLLALKSASWWWYILLVIGPDIGMIGYLGGPRLGAITYNILHHKGIAVLLFSVALFSDLHTLFDPATFLERTALFTALVLFGHSCMDRALGYGLKFTDSFQHTHLGMIGKGTKPTA
jgi:hypothetical protein